MCYSGIFLSMVLFTNFSVDVVFFLHQLITCAQQTGGCLCNILSCLYLDDLTMLYLTTTFNDKALKQKLLSLPYVARFNTIDVPVDA